MPEEDNIPDPLLEEPVDEKSARGVVSEFVRKVALAGLGAVFMTEEGIRHLAGQLKLPKEALSFILSQAERTKDEIGRVASEEIRGFFQSEKLRSEFLKLLAGMTIEVKAEVRLLPRREPKAAAGEELSPSVDVVEVHARRKKKKE
ncbi:MAG: hypothetical protein HYZ28_13710 [Myxococcales bacterium]|nr:hypothetical protein [Myxococcales bacterium]